jgi:exosortase/archaeosortase family protein
MLLIVAVIFLVCFPLRSWIHRGIVVAAAPIVAMTSNILRIAMLTLFAANQSSQSEEMFNFFHQEAGSFLFSGIGVSVIATFYIALINQQFSVRNTQQV